MVVVDVAAARPLHGEEPGGASEGEGWEEAYAEMAGYGEERQEDEVGDAEGKPQEITEGWEDQENESTDHAPRRRDHAKSGKAAWNVARLKPQVSADSRSQRKEW